MHQFLPYAWFQGQCVPFEARISIATHALHYGTGAFGGMRAIQTLRMTTRCCCFVLIGMHDASAKAPSAADGTQRDNDS